MIFVIRSTSSKCDKPIQVRRVLYLVILLIALYTPMCFKSDFNCFHLIFTLNKLIFQVFQLIQPILSPINTFRPYKI